jgi:hypothetical protein
LKIAAVSVIGDLAAKDFETRPDRAILRMLPGLSNFDNRHSGQVISLALDLQNLSRTFIVFAFTNLHSSMYTFVIMWVYGRNIRRAHAQIREWANHCVQSLDEFWKSDICHSSDFGDFFASFAIRLTCSCPL